MQLPLLDENDFPGTGELVTDVGMLFPEKGRYYLRHTVNNSALTRNKAFVSGTVGISRSHHKYITGSEMIQAVVYGIDTASRFQVEKFVISVKVFLGHREAGNANLALNIDTVIIFLCVHICLSHFLFVIYCLCVQNKQFGGKLGLLVC